MLIAGGCEAQGPAAPPSSGRVAEPAAPDATPVAAPPNQPPTSEPPAPPDGLSELGPEFPLVRVRTQTSFAHDRGDMTTLERVEVAGEPCSRDEVLARIVARWQGWTPAGGRSDADVLRTTQAFVEAWDRLLEVERVTDDAVPADLASSLSLGARRSRPLGGPPEAPELAYHPPRYELLEDGGERVVVASYFVRGHISQRGRHWSYVVSAFRVKDGAHHPIAPGSTLPQPRWFSEVG